MYKLSESMVKSNVLKVILSLVVIVLLAVYILKIFFPTQFIMAIENDVLVAIGTYIDNHLWLYIIIAIITNFLTYFLYLCAVLEKWTLNWKELLTIFIVSGALQGIYEIDAMLYAGLSLISMIILPCIFKAKFKNVAIVFSFHYMAQIMLTVIRSLPLLLYEVNFITVFLMGIDLYLWLLFFYLYYNMKRRTNDYGQTISTSIQNRGHNDNN